MCEMISRKEAKERRTHPGEIVYFRGKRLPFFTGVVGNDSVVDDS